MGKNVPPRQGWLGLWSARQVTVAAVALVLALSGLGAVGLSAGADTDARGADSNARGADANARAGSRKLYWGAWIGDQLTGEAPPYDMSGVSKFEKIVGKRLSLLEFAVPFADCSGTCDFFEFPAKEMGKIRAHGAIPFLSWSSQSIGQGGNPAVQPNFQLSDVTAGRYDAYIRSFAEQIKQWGHPYFMRFNWEMNGNWFAWGVRANGNKPRDFVPAWRHVHKIFARVGANNTTWVWCPYVDTKGKQNLRKLYPGNAYVDWTCLDVYNWGKSAVNPHPWIPFRSLFESSYRRVVKIAPRKPMVIAETASSDFGGNKPAWIRKQFKLVLNRYRRVKGYIYFDVNDRGTHWPIETSKPVIRAFRRGVRNRAFAGNRFGRIKGGKIRPLGR